ncbi:Bifunctional protein GlmU [uncultured archaeon]|nr:Bifunctional protein GlmU [uncultured archaeon]
MKVVILCGGLGTRLREETEYRPKPMVNIGTRPILWHIMKLYSHFGYNDFVLCLGYKGNIIKEYFYNYEVLNSDFTIELGRRSEIKIHNSHDEDGWRITLADTGEKALKGARLKKIEKYIDTDTFMVTYGDGLANINIKNLVNFHKQHGKIATLTGILPPSRFGTFSLKDNVIEKFTEKPHTAGNYVNGGFFVLEREIFDHMTFEDSCDFEIGVLDKLAEKGELMMFRHSNEWMCMDTMRDVEYLNNLWSSNQAFWKIWE